MVHRVAVRCICANDKEMLVFLFPSSLRSNHRKAIPGEFFLFFQSSCKLLQHKPWAHTHQKKIQRPPYVLSDVTIRIRFGKLPWLAIHLGLVGWLVGLIGWCLPIPLPCGLPALVRCGPGAFFMVGYFAFHSFMVDYFAFRYCLSNHEIFIPLTFIFLPPEKSKAVRLSLMTNKMSSDS